MVSNPSWRLFKGELEEMRKSERRASPDTDG